MSSLISGIIYDKWPTLQMYAPGFGPPVGGGMGPGFQNFRELSRLAKFPTFRNSEFGMHEQRDLDELWMIHDITPEFSLIQPKTDP